MAKVELFGVQVDDIGLERLVDEIEQKIGYQERCLISHVNVTGLNLAYQNNWLKDFYNQCDRVYCDGMGVILGARVLGKRLTQRFTLADWIWVLAENFSRSGGSIFLLGSSPGVAERASQRIQARYPAVQIAGCMHGFFNKEKAHTENEQVLSMLNAANPDLLLVGMGMPLQEQWLQENWGSLNARVSMTCGALFEYIAGDLPRGPQWMTDNYLEWLARMLISPKRYTRRYLRDNPLFLYRILKQKIGLKNDDRS